MSVVCEIKGFIYIFHTVLFFILLIQLSGLLDYFSLMLIVLCRKYILSILVFIFHLAWSTVRCLMRLLRLWVFRIWICDVDNGCWPVYQKGVVFLGTIFTVLISVALPLILASRRKVLILLFYFLLTFVCVTRIKLLILLDDLVFNRVNAVVVWFDLVMGAFRSYFLVVFCLVSFVCRWSCLLRYMCSINRVWFFHTRFSQFLAEARWWYLISRKPSFSSTFNTNKWWSGFRTLNELRIAINHLPT